MLIVHRLPAPGLSPRECAKRLGISHGGFMRYVHAGRVPVLAIGVDFFIDPANLEQLANEIAEKKKRPRRALPPDGSMGPRRDGHPTLPASSSTASDGPSARFVACATDAAPRLRELLDGDGIMEFSRDVLRDRWMYLTRGWWIPRCADGTYGDPVPESVPAFEIVDVLRIAADLANYDRRKISKFANGTNLKALIRSLEKSFALPDFKVGAS